MGFIDLKSLILRDDISKTNDKLEDARGRAGCEKIDDTLKRKQLSVNYDKSKYLIMGNNNFRKDTLKELKSHEYGRSSDRTLREGEVPRGHDT